VQHFQSKYLNEITCPKESFSPFIWAIKMEATASYKAVPSMLIVAPIGRTNLETLLSTKLWLSRHLNIIEKIFRVI